MSQSRREHIEKYHVVTVTVNENEKYVTEMKI